MAQGGFILPDLPCTASSFQLPAKDASYQPSLGTTACQAFLFFWKPEAGNWKLAYKAGQGVSFDSPCAIGVGVEQDWLPQRNTRAVGARCRAMLVIQQRECQVPV